jgi:very-short-patch-repair endonuclease
VSALEDTFELQLKALKLLGYEREYRFHATRRWRFDFAFPAKKIAIELHGAIFTQGRHSRGVGIEGDMEKINEAQLLGWDVLCFSGGMVKNGEAVKTLERLLQYKSETT